MSPGHRPRPPPPPAQAALHFSSLFPRPRPAGACPPSAPRCAARRGGASRASMTSGRSVWVQPSSPSGPAAPAPTRGRSSRGTGLPARTPRPSRTSLCPSIGARRLRARPGPGTAGEGRAGSSVTVSCGGGCARTHAGRALPQRRGRQRRGGARPDAGGKTEAAAEAAAAAAAGDPGGRPGHGGRHGRRHSGDAAPGGARGRDPGTARPPIPLSASAPRRESASAANRRAEAG